MIAVVLFLLAAAQAGGASADIELVRPTFSHGSLPGADSPLIDEPGALRYGGFLMYERDPLILYERKEELGVVVSNRLALQLGVSWDLGRVATVRLMVPSALQWGSELPDLSQDGPLFGDIQAGVKLALLQPREEDRGLGLSLRVDGFAPSGSRSAWMGEEKPRVAAGATALYRLGPFDLIEDLGVMARQDVLTPNDFTLGSELVSATGLRYSLWPERAALYGELLTRSGLEYLGTGGAENSSEVIGGVQLWPRRDLLFDAGVGKGLADGYGTTGMRVLVGLTYVHRPPPPEPPPRVVITEVPEESPTPPPPPPPPPPPEEWGEKELAKVKGEQIVIRDPIQFEFNTENILGESLPVVQSVATIMNTNWQIAHVVVEGHASEEGSYVYNYDLSIRRARAVWEQLIRYGVHPDRISFRAMGETVGKVQGSDEATLAVNRRVEFDIIKQWEMGDKPPPLREGVLLPWSGEAATIILPPPPPPLPEKKRELTPADKLNVDRFLEEEDDDASPPTTPPASGEGPK